MDAIVFAGLFATGYAIVAVARYWFSAPVAAVEISLSPCGHSALRVLFAGAHDRRLCAEPGVCDRLRIFRRLSTSAWKRPCSRCSTSCSPFRC